MFFDRNLTPDLGECGVLQAHHIPWTNRVALSVHNTNVNMDAGCKNVGPDSCCVLMDGLGVTFYYSCVDGFTASTDEEHV